MRAYLITADDMCRKLPELLEWELEYGCGEPCDSFRVSCLWSGAQEQVLADAVRFTAWQGEDLVFSGVVDECEVSWSAQGCRLEVSGRGLAALLLDNEAQGMDYDVATIQEILQNHVLPYGIRVARQDPMPAVERFSVAKGSSEWSVLYQFAKYHGGVLPRFDRQGQLILGAWEDGEARVIHDRVPVTSMSVRDRRYGVLSEVWVWDAGKQAAVQKVVNQSFWDKGGRCRRMITMPSKNDYQTMRYRGEYQLKQSEKDRLRQEVEIALPFCAWPGELIQVQRVGWGHNGMWRVGRSTVSMDNGGYRTRLELVPPDTTQ